MTEKQRSLVGGISLLSIAGMICKIVGVLYRIPLANLIGGEGLGLYQQVYPTYNLLLTITSTGIPVAISRTVSHYVTLKDTDGAGRVFRTALLILSALGVFAFLLMLLLGGSIAALVGTPEGGAAYRCIAPSLLFVCVMSAFRGYMQGRRHMLPTAVSQLIEQVGKVAIALPMAGIGFHRGGWVMGAAGALLGTSLAECAAMLYMILLTVRDRRQNRAEPLPAPDREKDRAIARRLVRISIPITLGACIVPMASWIDSAMLKNLMMGMGFAPSEAGVRYGLYSGLVLTMINVPTAIAMAMSTNLVPDIASGIARNDREYVAREAGTGLRLAAAVGFPCSIGMSILAKPIIHLCYASSTYTPQELMLAGSLLEVSAMTIVLFTMVQATSGILQGAGRQKIPMYTLLAGVACKVALNMILVRIPQVNIHGAPIASLVCYTVSMVPNLRYSSKYASVRLSVGELLIRPLGASACMGAVVYGIWHAVFGGESWLARGGFINRLLPVAICILAGMAVYVFAAWKLKVIRPEDLPARFRRRKQG